MTSVTRNLSLSIDQSSLIRYDTYDGDQYMVVPCIALVGDQVVQGLNSKGPEFVPAVELALSTPQWNNRPILADHPQNGITSANSPRILETSRFGWTFNSEFDNNKLKLEAWLSESRAKKVGSNAEWVIEELKAGRMVELSVGAYIELEESKGISPSGKPYEYVWRNVGSDHLAIGLSGGIGACSISAGGCGALRVNQSKEQEMGNQHPESKAGDGNQETKGQDQDESKNGLLSRFLRLMTPFRGLLEDQGPSDQDIRWSLENALYEIEPAFGYVKEVFQESNTCHYCTFPYSEKQKWWRRSFTVSDSGVVTLNSDREEIAFEKSAVIVAANTTMEQKSECGCKKSECECKAKTSKEERKMATKDELITKLQNMPQDQLERMVAGAETTPATEPVPASGTGTGSGTPVPNPNPNPVPVPTPTNPSPTPSPDTISLPKLEVEALRAMAAREIEREKQEKEQLVAFCASKQKVIPAANLQNKSLADLRELASVLNPSDPPDFSARGIPILSDNSARGDDKYTPPDPLGINKYLYPS